MPRDPMEGYDAWKLSTPPEYDLPDSGCTSCGAELSGDEAVYFGVDFVDGLKAEPAVGMNLGGFAGSGHVGTPARVTVSAADIVSLALDAAPGCVHNRGMSAGVTPAQFIAKWSPVSLPERAAFFGGRDFLMRYGSESIALSDAAPPTS